MVRWFLWSRRGGDRTAHGRATSDSACGGGCWGGLDGTAAIRFRATVLRSLFSHCQNGGAGESRQPLRAGLVHTRLASDTEFGDGFDRADLGESHADTFGRTPIRRADLSPDFQRHDRSPPCTLWQDFLAAAAGGSLYLQSNSVLWIFQLSVRRGRGVVGLGHMVSSAGTACLDPCRRRVRMGYGIVFVPFFCGRLVW